jgi:uncharacterized protein YeaO (DUF488 family)
LWRRSSLSGFTNLLQIKRLWPRGVSKEKANADKWMKDIAPSADLRKWFDHMEEKWTAFSKAYETELKNSDLVTEILDLIQSHETVTLLYGSRDEKYNHGIVLRNFLNKELKKISS